MILAGKQLLSNLKSEGWWNGLSSRATYVANVKPQFQTPVPPKKKERANLKSGHHS
jgi:hypothetical protein